MQNKLLFSTLVMILGLFILSACGAAEPRPTVPGPTPTLADEREDDTLQSAPATLAPTENGAGNSSTDSARSTSTAVPPDTIELQESYPIEPQLSATITPEGYPAPPEPPPTVDPYPGGLVWVLHPVGVQCEEGALPGYSDLDQAKATLSDRGIPVVNIQLTDLMVAAQCGGPTSAHYRAQIGAESLATAVALNWQPEN